MIETHTDPDNAWSDAAQQITPETLIQYTKDLKIRKESTSEADYTTDFRSCRPKLMCTTINCWKILGSECLLRKPLDNKREKRGSASNPALE